MQLFSLETVCTPRRADTLVHFFAFLRPYAAEYRTTGPLQNPYSFIYVPVPRRYAAEYHTIQDGSNLPTVSFIFLPRLYAVEYRITLRLQNTYSFIYVPFPRLHAAEYLPYNITTAKSPFSFTSLLSC